MTARPRQLRILGLGNARSVIFQRWAWRLVERGHQVFVVSDRRPRDDRELRGIELYDIRRLEWLTRVRGLRRTRFGPALGRLAERLEIDLVHGHYLLPYGFWAARARTHPLVVSPWGTDILVESARGGRDRRRCRTAITAADGLVVNSHAAAEAAEKLGASPDRIVRIVWYADLDRFVVARRDQMLRHTFGWPDDALVLLSLRNLRPDTNIDVIIRAFARLVDREPRARLVVAFTAGPLRSELEQLVDSLGLRSKVAFTSAGEHELPSLVASSDLLVAMTRSDSTPASLLEAMAAGLPVVCARAASLDEWIDDGDGGFLVPQRNETALASAVLELLHDPVLRQRFGERNRDVVQARVPPAGPELEQVYLRLLGLEPAPNVVATVSTESAVRNGFSRP
jgi:glycosyltransferase involved in cell wall biosynthesis